MRYGQLLRTKHPKDPQPEHWSQEPSVTSVALVLGGDSWVRRVHGSADVLCVQQAAEPQKLVKLTVWIWVEIWTKLARRSEESGGPWAQTVVTEATPLLLKPEASSAQGCQSQKGSVTAPRSGL